MNANASLSPNPSRPLERERAYQEIRDQVDSGDLLCFRGRGLISATIRRLTRSRYSHVGLLFVMEGRRYCIEAVETGVRLVLVSELVKRYEGGIDCYRLVNASPQQRAGAVGFAFQQLGKLYDKASFWPFLLYLLTGKRRRTHCDGQWFCSEMVAEAYRRQGLRFTRASARYTAPSDIASSEQLAFQFSIKK